MSWWGRRWIAAAEALGAAYANRLPRGRRYAEDGSVLDIQVAPGQVAAKVQGRRPNPYRVRLRVPELSDDEWEQVADRLAEEVRYSVALVEGRLPEDIDDLLRELDISLFPHAGELETSCSCPDVANPCKHAAAVHYMLAESINADPFLLTLLRGRDRDELLEGIDAARVGRIANSGPDVDEDDDDSYEEDAAADGRLSSLSAATLFVAPGDLASVAVQPARSADPGAVLRRMGLPPEFDEAGMAALTDVVAGAAATAWSLAGELDRDDPLLVALRERGSASAIELGDALDRSTAEVRAGLNALLAEGLVHRTGHAKSTRYHA